MAQNQTLQHKRTTVNGNIPTADKIAVGELALNLADYSIYTKTPSGDIIQLACDVIKSATQPTSPPPVNGDLWYNTSNDILNVFNGTSWVPSNFSGLPVLPANTTATPTWSTGAGTHSSPYVFDVVVTPAVSLLVTSVVVTDLAPGQLVPITDLNSTTNGGRFSFTNNTADGSGTLRFNIIFTDLPASASGATFSAIIRIGTATVYMAVNAAITSTFPQPVVAFPTELGAVTTQWTAPADSLTSTGDIEISTNGVAYSQGPLSITSGGTLYTRWSGAAGSGIGIDSANGTTITGSVVAASNSTSTTAELVISKTPDAISFIPQTGVAQNSAITSNVVTIDGVNSYLYLTSSNTVFASIDGGTFTSVPTSGTSLFIEDGQTLALRQTSSSSATTATTVTVNIGTGSASFTVTTIDAGIVTPSITTPINGSSGISTGITITSSAYSVVGAVGTHLNSDWEIYNNVGLTGSPVASSLVSTTNLTSWLPTGLSNSTQYWVRVRYRSSSGVVSAYSPVVTWTTGNQIGVNWTTVTSTALGTGTLYTVVWNGSQYLVAGSSNKVATSPDGVTWTDRPGLTTAGTITQSNWNGSQYIVGGGDTGKGGDGVVGVSPNGSSWTQYTYNPVNGDGDKVTCVTWTGSSYVMASSATDRNPQIHAGVYISTTGTSWTGSSNLNTLWGDSPRPYAIVWTGTVVVVVGSSGKVATSPTGATWTNKPALGSSSWGTTAVNVIIWTGTQLIIGGGSGKIAISSDLGTTWTVLTSLSDLPSWGTTTSVTSMLWTGTQLIVGGASGKIATSSDLGTTWTYQPGLSTTAWGTATVHEIATNGTQLLVVGASGLVAVSS